MSRRAPLSPRGIVPIAAALLLLGAVPALADANGSTEVQTVDRRCGDGGNNQYSGPGPNDCKGANGAFDPNKSYKSQYNSNDVKCGRTNAETPDNPAGVTVYRQGNVTEGSGGLGTCSDGGSLPAKTPIQGRADVSGSSSGGKVVVDGDKDNAVAPAQGYAVIEGKPQPAPPTVRCGDDHSAGGKADSDHMQGRDAQDKCG